MFKKFLWALLIGLGTVLPGVAQKNSPIGLWQNEEKRATFEIFKCGDKLCAKIVSLVEPNDKNGKPRTDIENPDPKLKTKPMLGLVFMKNFGYDEDETWENGTIYDPKNGKTYSSYLKMLGPDKIEVRGYVGFSMIGRSQMWTRVK